MKKILKFLKILFCTILIALLLLGTIIFLNGHSVYKTTISELPVKETLDEIRNKENFIEYKNLPEIFVNAVVAVEDKRFFDHPGVDIISIGRAVVTNIKDAKLSEGGSTITQQIAKNIFFSQKKEFTRKVAEIFVALDIEEIYSKEEIIEIYVNTNFYGSRFLWNI